MRPLLAIGQNFTEKEEGTEREERKRSRDIGEERVLSSLGPTVYLSRGKMKRRNSLPSSLSRAAEKEDKIINNASILLIHVVNVT